MKRSILSAAAACAIALSAQALADSDMAKDSASAAAPAPVENSWSYVAYKQDVDDDDRDSAIDYTYVGSMVFTSSTDEPGIVFTCSDRQGLGASVGLKPIDFSTVFENTSSRLRRKTVEARFNGGEPDNSTWIQLPSFGTIEPREPRLRRKLYNAVLRGETLTVKLDGRDAVTITFPPVDEDFTRWAMECPVTKPS